MATAESLKQRFIELSSPLEPEPTGTTPELHSLQGIRVVVYDFYGTLFISGVGDIGIDDGSSDASLFLEALKQAGIEVKDNRAGTSGFDFYNDTVNRELDRLRRAGSDYPEPDIRKVWKQVLIRLADKHYIGFNSVEYAEQLAVEFEARMNPVWPMPDAVSTLTYFSDKGLLQGIISNSQFYTPLLLEALTGSTLSKLGFHSDLLQWSYKAQLKKPDLVLYEQFLEKLQSVDPAIQPPEILYTGNDMLKDIYPAQAAGMKTALFAGDQRSLKWRREDPRCKGITPDLIITTLSQLKECIG